MSHVDPDLLSLHAFGEAVLSEADLSHLRSCVACAAEAESLSAVAALASGAPEVTLAEPPSGLWAAVAEATGIAASSRADTEPSTPAGPVSPAAVRGAEDDRPKRWPLWIAAAVLIGVVGGVAGVIGWQALNDDRAEETLAEVDLNRPDDESTPALGSARLVEADDRRVLSVSLDDADPESGFLQVWLLAPDASSLISLGVLEGPTGSFDLPAGLDLAEFPVVDVSVEPFDGDPGHSGESLARGEIEALE